MIFATISGFSGMHTLTAEADLTEPIWWINGAAFILFVAHPWALIYTDSVGYAFYDRFDIAGTYTEALTLGWLFTLAANFGAVIGRRRKLGRAANRAARTSKQTSSFIWAAGIASVVAFIVLPGTLTGEGASSGSAGAGRTAYVYLLPLMLIGSACTLIALGQSASRVWLSRTGWAIGAVYSVILLVSGQRSSLLLALLAPVVTSALMSRRRAPRITLLVGGCALAAAFGLIRDANAPGETFWSSVSYGVREPGSIFVRTVTGNDTEMVDALAVELSIVPEVIPHRPLSTVTSTLGAPVPRLVWPDKPETVDVVLNGYLLGLGSNSAGPAYSLVGEAYFDSGWPGVGAAGLGLGYVFTRLWRHQKASSEWRTKVVYAVLLAGLPIIIRGVVAYSLAIFLAVLLPVVLGWVLLLLRGSPGLVDEGQNARAVVSLR
ncbi:O-antigen polysaccharide polymerase Wzy [Blastococcus sp. TF02A_35]|uniref:O-antigen polysaccharide polymerase Wzy n=1 Tax=Blastococcus sp. TF02A-35 TaxID=2559612 RepID=UPI00142F8260|nr:O-antigen polysaccharide polymerase Wzy [Blastococcus sp. TF02A_35]